MNELTKKEESNLTLAEKLKLRRTTSPVALLLDTSGSMSSDCEPGLSKIQALRNTVAALSGNPDCYWFGTNNGQCTKDTIPNPSGGTKLHAALEMIKSKGIMKTVVMTDGMVDNPARTLEVAKGMNIKVMYIGAGERPKFLDELASACGGFATTEDLKEQKKLTDKIQLLIGSGSGEKPRGPIQL